LYWCYVAGFVVAFAVGFFYQWSVLKKEREIEKRKKQHPYMQNTEYQTTDADSPKNPNTIS